MHIPENITWEMLKTVRPDYWLQFGRAYDGIGALLSAQSDPEFVQALQAYPILLFPLIPQSIQVLAEQPDEDLKQALMRLAEMVQWYQERFLLDHPQNYAAMLIEIGNSLGPAAPGNLELNLKTAILAFRDARAIFPPGSENHGVCLMNEGAYLGELGNSGIDTDKNLRTGLDLLEEAIKLLPKGGLNYGKCLMNEGVARNRLRKKGVDPKADLSTSIDFYVNARASLPKGGLDYVHSLLNESSARIELAEKEIEPLENLERALELLAEGGLHASHESTTFADCLRLEALVRIQLAQDGSDAQANLDLAIKCSEKARTIFGAEHESYVVCLRLDHIARCELVALDIEVERNLEIITLLTEQVSQLLPPDDPGLAHSLKREATARIQSANRGRESLDDLRTIIQLFEKARSIFAAGTTEFADCLRMEGGVRLRMGRLGFDAENNLVKGIALYQQARTAYAPGDSDLATCLSQEARIRMELAELGVEPKKNLELACRLLDEALAIDAAKSEDVGNCMASMAHALYLLANHGIETRANLERAIQLYHDSRALVSPSSESFAMSLTNEGLLRDELSELGVESVQNLMTAIKLHQEARLLLPENSVNFALTLNNEGGARLRLANNGIEPKENSKLAIDLFIKAREVLAEGTHHYAMSLMNEGYARHTFAEQGLEQRETLWQAIQLVQRARSMLPEGRKDFIVSLTNEAAMRIALADQGCETRENLQLAVRLYQQARPSHPENSQDLAHCLMNEGTTRSALAAEGVHPEENLRMAIKLHQQARQIFPRESQHFALCLMNEANTRCTLAGKEELQAALLLYEEARTIFSPTNVSLGKCLANEGRVRVDLALKNVDPRNNLLTAISLNEQALKIFTPDSQYFAACLANQGRAHLALANEGFDIADNITAAIRTYRASLDLRTISTDELGMITSYNGLGCAYVSAAAHFEDSSLSYDREAKKAWAAAIDIIDRLRASLRLTQDRRSILEDQALIFRRMIETCIRLGDFTDALEYIERGRSRLMLDLLYLRDFEPQNVPTATIESYRSLLQRADELDLFLNLEGSSETQDEQVRVMLHEKDEVIRKLRKTEHEIQQLDPDYFLLAKPADFAAMQRAAQLAGRTLITFWVGFEVGMVFYVRPTGEFEAQLLDHLTIAWLRVLLFGERENGSRGWYTSYHGHRRGLVLRSDWMSQISQTLTELQSLLDPIAQKLKSWDETRIAFIVGGYLGLLPLHTALEISSQSETGTPANKIDIVYAPSVWILQRCLERERTTDAPAGIIATRGDGPDIPFALWEQSSIHARISQRLGKDSCVTLPNSVDHATLDTVLDLLPDLSLAHFCCHGSWNHVEPLLSALHLDDGLLALALLFKQVPCRQVRLVVLSACESAIGLQSTSDGEEYLGLPAGFLFAGARSVIGSLWPVPDLSTALLMRRFYDELLDGQTASLALQSAQRWLRNLGRAELMQYVEEAEEFMGQRLNFVKASMLEERPFSHPYYWGAFQLLGSPEPVFYPQTH